MPQHPAIIKGSLGTGNSNNDTARLVNVTSYYELMSDNDEWPWNMVRWNWTTRLQVTLLVLVLWKRLLASSVCELAPDQKRKGSIPEVDWEQQVCTQKLKKLPDQTSLEASFITTCQEFLNCVCGRTPCNDIYGEALPKSFQASDITIKG